MRLHTGRHANVHIHTHRHRLQAQHIRVMVYGLQMMYCPPTDRLSPVAGVMCTTST